MYTNVYTSLVRCHKRSVYFCVYKCSLPNDKYSEYYKGTQTWLQMKYDSHKGKNKR
jgi:hypothetical protein